MWGVLCQEASTEGSPHRQAGLFWPRQRARNTLPELHRRFGFGPCSGGALRIAARLDRGAAIRVCVSCPAVRPVREARPRCILTGRGSCHARLRHAGVRLGLHRQRYAYARDATIRRMHHSRGVVFRLCTIGAVCGGKVHFPLRWPYGVAHSRGLKDGFQAPEAGVKGREILRLGPLLEHTQFRHQKTAARGVGRSGSAGRMGVRPARGVALVSMRVYGASRAFFPRNPSCPISKASHWCCAWDSLECRLMNLATWSAQFWGSLMLRVMWRYMSG